MAKRLFALWFICVLPAAATLVSSCAPTYDSIADQMVVSTQKQADDGLLKLENTSYTIETLPKSQNPADQKSVAAAKAQASYAANVDFYSGLQSSLIALDARMTALPDLSTPKLTDALSKIETNVNAIRELHQQENILHSAYLRSARQILDQQFKVLTVYELTIKNGSKPQ